MRSRDRSTYVLRFPLKPSYVCFVQSSPVQVFHFRSFIAGSYNFLFSLCQIFFEKLSLKKLSSKFYRSLLLISKSCVLRYSYSIDEFDLQNVTVAAYSHDNYESV